MPHRSIEQIKANVRLEEIVRQRGVILRATSQGGERLEGQCPFHAFDETPSFNVYRTTQRYHCFGCGASGDVIDFVQAFDGCSFQEALDRLAGTLLPLPTAHLAHLRPPRTVVPILFPLPSDVETSHEALLTSAQRHYHQTLLVASSLQTMLLRVRGITEQGIRSCGLGYVDGSFLQEGQQTPEQRQEAQQIGLLSAATQRERLWHRLILPECAHDRCTWMIGRSLFSPITGTRDLKYLGVSMPKPLLGYGLALERICERRLIRAIVVVEGAIDYVIASQWDLPIVCVALIGTHASLRQLTMLLDLQQRTGWVPLLISLDADDAGRQASQHLFTQLRQSTPFVSELLPFAAGVKDIGDLGIHPEGYHLLQVSIEQALGADSPQEGEHA